MRIDMPIRIVVGMMFFCFDVHAKPCIVNVCTSLAPGAKCYRKVIRHSGRIELPKGYFIVGGCHE